MDKIGLDNIVHPFNNSIETGLRILAILDASFPEAFDISKLVYLDYIVVHSGDIDSAVSSLHPPVPYRSGEIQVRRTIIETGLELFVSKGLINKRYSNQGILYEASETSTPFLELLGESYSLKLLELAKWLAKKYILLSDEELKSLLLEKLSNQRDEFNFEILN